MEIVRTYETLEEDIKKAQLRILADKLCRAGIITPAGYVYLQTESYK